MGLKVKERERNRRGKHVRMQNKRLEGTAGIHQEHET